MAAVPEEVRDAIRSELAVKANVNDSAAERRCSPLTSRTPERARLVQGRMRHQTLEVCQFNPALSDFFDGLGIAHPKVSHCVAAFQQENGPLGAPLHPL